MALAALIAITRDGVVAVGILFVLCGVGVEYGLRRVARVTGLPRWLGMPAAALCMLNPFVTASIGMEVMPAAALTALLLAASVEQRPLLFGALSGLLLITRADLAIVVIAVFLLRRRFWVGWSRTFLAALPIVAGWYIISWFVLGSAVPFTLAIKTLHASWGNGEWTFNNGLYLYYLQHNLMTLLAVLPAAAGVLGGLWWTLSVRVSETARRLTPLIALPVAAAGHFGTYCMLGVPPFHWYYAPSIVFASMFLAAVVTAVTSRQRWQRTAALAPVILLLTAFAASYVRPGLPRLAAPITTNHAYTEQYRQIALDIHRVIGDQPVAAPAEIGVLAYYYPGQMIDYFSDPGRFPPVLASYEKKFSGFGRMLIDLNFMHFDRNQEPQPTAYKMIETSTPPANAIASWRIQTSWRPDTVVVYIVLLPNN